MDYRKMFLFPNYFRFVTLIAVFFSLTGCSLITIENEADPLPRRDVNMRIMTHDFARSVSSVVEQAADSVIVETSNIDIQINALRWKISALLTIRMTVFQTSPEAALVDTWTFCKQMNLFFRQGNGKAMFGEWQSIVTDACDSLETEITDIASSMLPAREFMTNEVFVNEYVQEHPLHDITFTRESVFAGWKSYMGIPDSVAVATVGTLPQVMDDFASRTMIYGEQIPQVTSWKADLFVKNNRLDSLRVQERLDSLNVLMERFAAIAENSPQLIDSSFKNLSTHLKPLLDNIDRQRLETLEALSMERAVLSESFRQGRIEVTADLERISNDLIERAMTHIRKMVSSILFFGLLIIIVVLGLPFTLGFIVGRTIKKSRGISPLKNFPDKTESLKG